DIPDDLSLAHMRAGYDAARKRRHVPICSFVSVTVLDLDIAAVSAVPRCLLHDAVACGGDRGAARRRPVDAGVHLRIPQHRMPPPSIRRAHDGLLHWL